MMRARARRDAGLQAGLLLGVAVYLAAAAGLAWALWNGRTRAALPLGAIVALPWVAIVADVLWMKWRSR